jgi:plastocyanin
MISRASHLCRERLRLLPCAAALAGALLIGAAAAVHAHETYTVIIENMRFTPATFSVHRGDRVVWVNKDLFPHTVTSDARRFESGDIAASASWSYRATAAGAYAYSCRLHPGMKGHFTVQP